MDSKEDKKNDENVSRNVVENGKDNKLQSQESLQSNHQELDQHQDVDVKPNQFSLQHIDVTINNKLENYSGKIIGTTTYERNGQLLTAAEILLYFGSDTNYPVYRTASDENGRFSIEDLPPGFYSIKAQSGYLQCLVRGIKILPGETRDQSLSLSEKVAYYNSI